MHSCSKKMAAHNLKNGSAKQGSWDVGRSLGITPQQALQGAKMAIKAGVL
jgi:hypothetical protein